MTAEIEPVSAESEGVVEVMLSTSDDSVDLSVDDAGIVVGATAAADVSSSSDVERADAL